MEFLVGISVAIHLIGFDILQTSLNTFKLKDLIMWENICIIVFCIIGLITYGLMIC